MVVIHNISLWPTNLRDTPGGVGWALQSCWVACQRGDRRCQIARLGRSLHCTQEKRGGSFGSNSLEDGGNHRLQWR